MLGLRVWLVVIVVLAGCGGGGGSTQRKLKPPPAPPRIAAKVKTFKLGGEVWDLAATPRLVWVAQRGEGRVLRIGRDGRPIGQPTHLSKHLGTLANDLAISGNDVFLAYAGNDGRVARLDPATGALGRPISTGRGAEKLAVGAGSAYVGHLTSIARVPLGGGRTRSVELHRTPNALLYARGELWATVSDSGSVLELNRRTLANENDFGVDTAQPLGMAEAAGSIWVAVAGDSGGELLRIDLKKRQEAGRIRLRTPYPFAVAYARNSLWVLDYYANTLTRVNPYTHQVTGRIKAGPRRNSDNIPTRVQAGLAAQGGALWVTDVDRGTLTRVQLP